MKTLILAAYLAWQASAPASDPKDAQIAALKAKIVWLEAKVEKEEAALKAVLDLANTPQWAAFGAAQIALKQHETEKPKESK